MDDMNQLNERDAKNRGLSPIIFTIAKILNGWNLSG